MYKLSNIKLKKNRNRNKNINKNKNTNRNKKTNRKNVSRNLTKKVSNKNKSKKKTFKVRRKRILKKVRPTRTITKDDIFVSRVEYGDMLDIGIEYIKNHNPEVDFKYYSFVSDPNLQDYRVLFLYTTPYNNHPYLFVRQRAENNNQNDNEIYILNPLGNKGKQLSDEELDPYISSLSELEKNMLVLYLKQNIKYRKNVLTENNYSLLLCSNITNCVRKVGEINRMNIPKVEKEKLIEKYELAYREKGIKVIDNYFNLLEERDYDEAKAFLKGNKGKYFNKTRLNTFFKNNKKVVGHLEVFIGIYKLLDKFLN